MISFRSILKQKYNIAAYRLSMGLDSVVAVVIYLEVPVRNSGEHLAVKKTNTQYPIPIILLLCDLCAFFVNFVVKHILALFSVLAS
jgi:hypothetical protein